MYRRSMERLYLMTNTISSWRGGSFLYRLVGLFSPWREGSYLLQWAEPIGMAIAAPILTLAPLVSYPSKQELKSG